MGAALLSPRLDPRRALHCWQRRLHRLVAGCGRIHAMGAALPLPSAGSAACPPLLAAAPPSTHGRLREDPRSGGYPSSPLDRIHGMASIAGSGAYIDSWWAMGCIGAVFHGGSPTSPAPLTSTVLRPVFPSVPSPRLGIPTSSGHGIHSARKVKAVAVCSQDPLSVAAG